MASIGWEELSHAQLTEALAAGLAERERRIADMLALTGGSLPALQQQTERRGPGRPAGSGNKSAREQQLEAAERGEAVQ